MLFFEYLNRISKCDQILSKDFSSSEEANLNENEEVCTEDVNDE